jgi:hypothetical protein
MTKGRIFSIDKQLSIPNLYLRPMNSGISQVASATVESITFTNLNICLMKHLATGTPCQTLEF